jgi:hypothetical protein
MYLDPVGTIIESFDVHYHQFADDTLESVSTQPMQHQYWASFQNVQQQMMVLVEWSAVERRQVRGNVVWHSAAISVNGNYCLSHGYHRNLAGNGVLFNNHIRFDKPVNAIARTCTYTSCMPFGIFEICGLMTQQSGLVTVLLGLSLITAAICFVSFQRQHWTRTASAKATGENVQRHANTPRTSLAAFPRQDQFPGGRY